MADQFTGEMIVGLLHEVEKIVPCRDRYVGGMGDTPFPQPGVFTLDIVPYFNTEGWLPFVLLAAAADHLSTETDKNCKAVCIDALLR